MLNSVILIGYLCEKPKKSEEEKKKENKFFQLVKFQISVKKPTLSYWQKNTHEVIDVVTFDFNIKKYSKILAKNHILVVKGRIININDKTSVFANYVHLIGKKQ